MKDLFIVKWLPLRLSISLDYHLKNNNEKRVFIGITIGRKPENDAYFYYYNRVNQLSFVDDAKDNLQSGKKEYGNG